LYVGNGFWKHIITVQLHFHFLFLTLEIPQLYHANSTRIKITGLMENMNTQMLEMFFDKEERDGGGKVKEIVIDNKNKCVIVDFEDETGDNIL
jgi:hypothetical protein